MMDVRRRDVMRYNAYIIVVELTNEKCRKGVTEAMESAGLSQKLLGKTVAYEGALVNLVNLKDYLEQYSSYVSNVTIYRVTDIEDVTSAIKGEVYEHETEV